jgi:hypothetical protein
VEAGGEGARFRGGMCLDAGAGDLWIWRGGSIVLGDRRLLLWVLVDTEEEMDVEEGGGRKRRELAEENEGFVASVGMSRG